MTRNSFTLQTFISFIFLFVTPICNAHISPIQDNLLTGWNDITRSILKDEITFLASDKLKGRLSLTHGDQQTITWIEKKFKEAGLKPAVGNSFLQAVPIIQYVPDRKKSYIMLTQKNNKKRWLTPEVYTEFFNNIHIESEVIFAGYGITAPTLNYDDYKNVDVTGKIVLVFEHEPQETNPHSRFNGTGNTIYATNRIKALNAQQHGAIAVLIAPEPNRRHPSNTERYKSVGGSVKRAIPLPSQVLVNDELHIPVAVVSDSVANIIAGSQLSLSNAQQNIDKNLVPQTQLISNTHITIHDENTSQSKGTTHNVVGLIEGNDATLKKETIIISAHHDHDGALGNKIWHGADDNASGTAGVITLAQAISKNSSASNGLKLKRSMLFVVFAAEERGLLGAYYLAAHPLRPLDTTRAMINFDMIGRNETASAQTNKLMTIPKDTSNRLNLIGTHYSPDYKKTVGIENQKIGLILDERFNQESALNVFFRSDQFPFVLHNIPAFWWFTGFHPDYHHTSDTANKINYSKMKKILRLAYLSSYDFANETIPPAFIKNPSP